MIGFLFKAESEEVKNFTSQKMEFIRQFENSSFNFELLMKGGRLFVPQLLGVRVSYSQEFLRKHVYYVNPFNPHQFVTLGGVFGLFSVDFQFISYVGVCNYQGDYSINLTSIFAHAQPLYQSTTSESKLIHIIRESSAQIRSTQIPILILSEIIFEIPSHSTLPQDSTDSDSLTEGEVQENNVTSQSQLSANASFDATPSCHSQNSNVLSLDFFSPPPTQRTVTTTQQHPTSTQRQSSLSQRPSSSSQRQSSSSQRQSSQRPTSTLLPSSTQLPTLPQLPTPTQLLPTPSQLTNNYFQSESQSLPGQYVFEQLTGTNIIINENGKARRSNSFSKSSSEIIRTKEVKVKMDSGMEIDGETDPSTISQVSTTTKHNSENEEETKTTPDETPTFTSPPTQSLFHSFSNLTNFRRPSHTLTMSSMTSPQTPSRQSPRSASMGGQSKFIQLINRPEAKDIANAIRRFIQKFLQTPPDPQKHAEVVRTFLEITEQQISIHSLWKSEKEDEEMTRDALEKLMTSKLYKLIFSPTEEDKKKDNFLKKKMKRLNQFLTISHLDIKESYVKDEYITRAIHELMKVNEFKAPRDKMVCIMNCCKVIYQMINSVTASEEKEAAGADDFFPILIYTFLRANIPQIHSNVKFIRQYRHPAKLGTEIGYYFTQFESVVKFVEEADYSRFSVEKEIWDRYMVNDTGCGVAAPSVVSASAVAAPSVASIVSVRNGGGSGGGVENGVNDVKLQNERVTPQFISTSTSGVITHTTSEGIPFVNVTDEKELRISDIALLLNAYKSLSHERDELKRQLEIERNRNSYRRPSNSVVPNDEKRDVNLISSHSVDESLPPYSVLTPLQSAMSVPIL
jgi:hypothetical protein